jgi:hypothetical protein
MRVVPRDPDGLSSLQDERPSFFSGGASRKEVPMEGRVLSSELPLKTGQKVRMQGWVHRIRHFGGVRFLVLRDRAGLAQVVVPREVDLGNISSEWVISVDGEC